MAKTIGIKLRYDDFKIATRDQTCDSYTDDSATIRRLAGQCLKRVPLEKKLRLLGVRAATLARADEVPLPDEKKPSTSSESSEVNTTDQLF